jgi:hypothetical protein
VPSRDVVTRFVQMVEAGQFVEAMEKYYAADANAQENNEPPRLGLSALIANERNTLAAFERIEGRSVGPTVIDGDTVVIHWQFVFHHRSGVVRRLEELAYQNWRDEKIVSERFFYDPRQLQP